MTHEDYKTLTDLYASFRKVAEDRVWEKVLINCGQGYTDPQILDLTSEGADFRLDDRDDDCYDGGSVYESLTVAEILMSDSEWETHTQELKAEKSARDQKRREEEIAEVRRHRESLYQLLKAEFEPKEGE